MKQIILFNPISKKREKNSHFNKRFIAFASKKGIKTIPLKIDEVAIHLDTNNKISLVANNSTLQIKESYIFTRIHGKNAYLLSLIYDAADTMNIPYNDVMNKYHIKSNKPTQTIKLSQAKLPYPSSVICTPNAFNKNKAYILCHVSFPVVLKGIGERGNAVWKIHSKKELSAKIMKKNDVYIIQKFLPNTSDIRILVYNQKVIGAIERSSADGFYNNISKGAVARQIELTPQEKKIAKKAAKTLDLHFAGVDIIRTAQGPYIIEVNKSPMIKGFEATTGIDVVQIIVDSVSKIS